MKIKAKTLVNYGVEVAITIGVGVVLDAAIKSVLPDKMGRFKKISSGIGTMAIVGLVSYKATHQAQKIVNEFFDGLDAARDKSLTDKDVENTEKDEE